jgi:hypothetical protein
MEAMECNGLHDPDHNMRLPCRFYVHHADYSHFHYMEYKHWILIVDSKLRVVMFLKYWRYHMGPIDMDEDYWNSVRIEKYIVSRL